MSCFCQHSWLPFVKERELILLHRGKYSHTDTRALLWLKDTQALGVAQLELLCCCGCQQEKCDRASVTCCCRAQMEIVSGQRCDDDELEQQGVNLSSRLNANSFLPEVTLVGMLLLQHVNAKSPNSHRVFWPLGSFLGEISALCALSAFFTLKQRWYKRQMSAFTFTILLSIEGCDRPRRRLSITSYGQ